MNQPSTVQSPSGVATIADLYAPRTEPWRHPNLAQTERAIQLAEQEREDLVARRAGLVEKLAASEAANEASVRAGDYRDMLAARNRAQALTMDISTIDGYIDRLRFTLQRLTNELADYVEAERRANSPRASDVA